MTIRLETSKRQGIENNQDAEVSAFHLNWARTLGKSHPHAKPRTSVSGIYNCHGLTFASRRTRIEKGSGIQRILEDDGYVEINLKDALPGDVVLYYSESGDPNHSGIVVETGQTLVPIICSKWGSAGEFVHGLRDCPSIYGPSIMFFRCNK